MLIPELFTLACFAIELASFTPLNDPILLPPLPNSTLTALPEFKWPMIHQHYKVPDHMMIFPDRTDDPDNDKARREIKNSLASFVREIAKEGEHDDPMNFEMLTWENVAINLRALDNWDPLPRWRFVKIMTVVQQLMKKLGFVILYCDIESWNIPVAQFSLTLPPSRD